MNLYDSVPKLQISEFVRNPERIYAHIAEDGQKKEPETLEEHTQRCEKYWKRLLVDKGLEDIFEKMEQLFLKNVSAAGVELFRKMAFHVVRFHDLGKINPHFQRDRMKNDLGKKMGCALNTHHSMASSILYLDIFLSDIKALPKQEQPALADFMLLHAYVISRHHGSLTTLEEFKLKLIESGEGVRLLDEEEQLPLLTQCYKRELSLRPRLLKVIFQKSDQACSSYDQEKKILRMFYVRLMFSLLTACDFYATSEYLQGFEQTEFGSLDIEPFYEHYRKGELYQNILKYKTHWLETGMEAKEAFSDVKDINILRNEMFLEAEHTLLKNLDRDIFYLDAPTGSGKSNIALNLSFQLLKHDPTKKKILYVYPFNTLVEQNIQTLQNSFGEVTELMDQITVVNSVTPIRAESKKGKLDVVFSHCADKKERSKFQFPHARKKEMDYQSWVREEEQEELPIRYYQSALLDRQFLNYPMTLTTHVSLFRFLFGREKEDLFALHQLVNSVIVLDEIQSYRNEIWNEIIMFLSCCAKLFNLKVIIMSATLPDLDLLSTIKGKTVQLIRDRQKYTGHPLFQNRVRPDFSLLESEDIHQDLLDHVKKLACKSRKILLEFIKKSSAMSFFQRLREAQGQGEFPECQVELMTGDDNTAERNRILDQVKGAGSAQGHGIILVATQVIEAGVDIDMDIGYKNISLLDSEEQFMGRINRSGKRTGTAYFFRLDDARDIYKRDVRINPKFTLAEPEIREMLRKKDFGQYYRSVLLELNQSKNMLNEENIDLFFDKRVGELEFQAIKKRMELIEDQSNRFTVFFDRTIPIPQEKIPLVGAQVWLKYRMLLSDREMDYAKRRIELSEIRAKMSYFTYQIYGNDSFVYEDRIGDLFYVPNGEQYFTEGKFDRTKFQDQMGLFIS